MKTEKIRTISIKSIIFPLIVIGFGISFIFTNKTFSAGTENWIQTTGQIIKNDGYDTRTKVSYVIVRYYVEPDTFEKRGDVFKSSYKVGDVIQIKYNPSNHSEFTMAVGSSIFIPFIVAGGIIIAIGAGMLLFEVSKGITAKKQLLENNSQLNLNYTPSFTFEYVPLKAENKESYVFRQEMNDFINYKVSDSKGKVLFYTKRIKKGLSSSATYQLIDSTTKQTTIVNLKKSSFNNANVELKIKVNSLPIAKYFETRHVTYNISKEGNSIKYTLFNNGSTLGFIYERNNNTKNFEIETAKENIDDLSLFALCLTFK